MKTVAGTPNSRNHTRARAPLLSHATARPRHAGTSFESQAQQGAGSGSESQACRDLSTLRARLTTIPARARNACKQLGGSRVPSTRRAVTVGSEAPVLG